MCQDPMERCQQISRHMKILDAQYGIVRYELNFSKDKIENLKETKLL